MDGIKKFVVRNCSFLVQLNDAKNSVRNDVGQLFKLIDLFVGHSFTEGTKSILAFKINSFLLSNET